MRVPVEKSQIDRVENKSRGFNVSLSLWEDCIISSQAKMGDHGRIETVAECFLSQKESCDNGCWSPSGLGWEGEIQKFLLLPEGKCE